MYRKWLIELGKAVLELQLDIINNEKDVVSILRKAHLIASKLDLKEFDTWILQELNGYDTYESIPEYRLVYGEIKAKNPYHGYIPVMLPSSLEDDFTKRKLFNSISEIVQLLQSKDAQVMISLPSDISKDICKGTGVVFPCYFIIGGHSLKTIVEKVKNTILEWCLQLDKDGIVGDDFIFTDNEKNKAKTINQEINNYYGQVIKGNVENSFSQSGHDNIQYNIINSELDEIEQSIKKELESEKMVEALEILEDIKEKINEKKKTSIIKNAFIGLKDFMIQAGASVTAALISNKINGM